MPRLAFVFCLLFALQAFSDQSPVKIGTASLTLPPGWTIAEACQDASLPDHVASGTDVKAMTLLLTAHPVDIGRRAGISLFRCNLHLGSRAPTLMPTEIGANAEAERLSFLVMGLGFTPVSVQIIRGNPSQNTPLLTVEMTARNSAGEERVFSNTVAGAMSPITRLFTSRQAADQTAAQEIAAIIKSIAVLEEAKNGSAPPTFAQDMRLPGSQSSAQGMPAPTTTPAPESTPMSASERSAQMVSDYNSALLMVEGQKGAGSGFLCKMGERTYAITNAHVICGNPGFKLTSLKDQLKVENGAIATEHDIVKMEVNKAAKSFEVMVNIDANAKIGDPVMVLGNAEGARVVRPIEGKIVGIGPNLIEVDAPFVPGNSGSPIIHTATGKVLGVATYLIERKVKGDGGRGVNTQTRRFGYRMDSVKTWEPINWQAFYAQAAQLEKIDELSADFIRLFNSSGSHYNVNDFKTMAMQHAIKNVSEASAGQNRRRAVGQAEEAIMLTQFLGELRSISRSDLGSFNVNTGYDYFRRQFNEQSEFRAEINKALTKAIDAKSF